MVSKRRTNITIEENLYQEAKELGINISASAMEGIRTAVEIRKLSPSNEKIRQKELEIAKRKKEQQFGVDLEHSMRTTMKLYRTLQDTSMLEPTENIDFVDHVELEALKLGIGKEVIFWLCEQVRFDYIKQNQLTEYVRADFEK